MKHGKFCICLAVLWILAVFVSPVFGQETEESIGQIVSVENTVTVTRAEGQEITGQPGLPLYAGDSIVTGENSQVKFSLKIKHTIVVRVL